MASDENRSRNEVLEQVSRARSQQEISDAGFQVKRYLNEHPDDTDVIAASERLHRRGVKLSDPPDEASWQTVATYMFVGLLLVCVPAAIMLLAGRSVQEALIVGVGLGVLVFWELTLVVAAGWESFGKKAVRILKARTFGHRR